MVSVPPLTVMSANTKSLVRSVKVKVTVAVSPLTSLVLSLLTITVGGVTSLVKVAMVTLLLTSAPSTLGLPRASRNLTLPTEMTLLAVLLSVGVKVAV